MGRRRGKKKSRRPKEKRNNNPTAGGSSSAPPPPWIELPRDLTVNILRRLGPEGILYNAQRVCTTWRSVCAEPSFWRVLYIKFSDIEHRICYAGRLCRRAVDCSQGQLIDLYMELFCSNDLLNCISQRCSSHLKKLSLEYCNVITPRGLTAALKNLSRLEELHLFFAPVISYLDIKTIGISCPMLNSFTFNDLVLEFEFGNIDNSHALSIAKNMPNLRRLCLVRNLLNNEGLLAILDGCPNLELLDLLLCYNVDMECDLGRRCSEQVKELRRPLDSSAGCEWDARHYELKDEDDQKDEDDFYDDYSDNSVGYCSDFGDDFFYKTYSDDFMLDPYSESAEFVWDNGI